jgi:hypothetical protein
VLQAQDHHGGNGQDDSGSYNKREPVVFLPIGGRDDFRANTHERNFTPIGEENPLAPGFWRIM